jgi:hypothetical protein
MEPAVENMLPLELLKIAASLTEAVIANKAKTAQNPSGTLPELEKTFQDCVAAVTENFKTLSRIHAEQR